MSRRDVDLHHDLAAALKAPPVPNDPHYMIPKPHPPGTSAIKLSPAVTHADMRRLAEVLDNSRSSWISRAINEVFKEPV